MAVVSMRVDDLDGSADATTRRIIIDEGKYSTVYEVDLVDSNVQKMLEKFKAAMSAYLRVGSVKRLKTVDLAGPTVVEGTVVESTRIELPPEGPTAKAIASKPRAPKSTVKMRAGGRRGGTDSRFIGSNGKPMRLSSITRAKRPGLKAWAARNGELLKLPPMSPGAGGRMHKEVMDAWDRYDGQDVTQDTLHPVDLERLTAPNIPSPRNSRL